MPSSTRLLATFIFCWSTSSWIVRSTSGDRLIFVHALFRHGIRAPVHLFPTDEGNPLKSWSQGLGELQSEGMRQMYELGGKVRDRYVNQYGFLNGMYKVNEVFYRSSDVNRTLSSALFVSAGFYEERTKLQKDWHPIPIHTWPKDQDQILSEDPGNCPRLGELDRELEKSAFVRLQYEQNKEFFRFLSKSTLQHITPINISGVYDTLRCELVTHGHIWPDWVNRTVFDKAEYLTRLFRVYQFGDFERIRLAGGMMLKALADSLRDQPQAIHDEEDDRLKMMLHSAHDANLMLLLSAFGLTSRKDFKPPDFGACVFVELWRNAQYGKIVKVFYRSSSTTEFVEFRIPNCGQPCRLEMFDVLIRRFVPDDWRTECGVKRTDASEEEVLKFLIASFSLTIFILIAAITILTSMIYQRRNSTKYSNYRPVDTAVLNRLLDENISDDEFSSLEFVDMNK